MRRSVGMRKGADSRSVHAPLRVPALRSFRDEGGAAIVEFALVLPVFLLVLFAIFQFGLTYNHYLTIEDAARVGARAAAVARLGTKCAAASSAVQATVGAKDWSVIVANGGVGCTSSWSSGAPVTITINYPYSIKIVGAPVYAGMLDAKAVERVE